MNTPCIYMDEDGIYRLVYTNAFSMVPRFEDFTKAQILDLFKVFSEEEAAINGDFDDEEEDRWTLWAATDDRPREWWAYAKGTFGEIQDYAREAVDRGFTIRVEPKEQV